MRAIEGGVAAAISVSAALACSSSGPWISPTVHASEVAFGVRDTLVLDFLPSSQSYAWVESSRIFTGTHPRDDEVEYWPSVQRLRESVDIPLAVINWYQLPDQQARYHATILFAQRTVLVPFGPRRVRSDGRVDQATRTSMRVYRGVAIRRVSDGATFYFVLDRGDRWVGEREVAGAVAALTLNPPPNPDRSFDATALPTLAAPAPHPGVRAGAARDAAERLVSTHDVVATRDVARRQGRRLHRHDRQ